MSEFLKKIKSVFIEDDGAAETAKPAGQQAETAAPSAQASTQTATPQPATSGAVSDKFLDVLMNALEKNNQAGFDYLEFRQALKNLAKMPMDEATRFHSAYAMSQTMGVTPAKLTESAQFYLDVLTKEQAHFNEAHAQQRARLIGNREEEIKNLEAAIQQKSEQIAQLTRQIEEHRQKSEQIRQEIADNTLKIESTKSDFDATLAAVAGQIEGDMAKIKEHLK